MRPPELALSEGQRRQLREWGYKDIYKPPGPHELAPYLVNFAVASRTCLFMTRYGPVEVLTHPLLPEPDDLSPPRDGQISFSLHGVPCVVGEGPCSVWKDSKLVNLNEGTGQWIVADVGGREGPYLIVAWEPLFSVCAVSIEGGLISSADFAFVDVGYFELGPGTYRLAPEVDPNQPEPRLVLEERVVTAEEQDVRTENWRRCPVSLEYDGGARRYRLKGGAPFYWLPGVEF